MRSHDPVNGIRAEAERWLSISEAQLKGRDFAVSKRFATRAREADPSLDAADQILAVVDTLLAGDNRIHNNPDFYGILQVPHQTDDRSLIRAQFRWLRDLISPVVRRGLPFADRAFALVSEAWSVLSSDKKSEYDNALDNGTDLNPDREPFQFDQTQSQQKRASRRSNRISKKNLAVDIDVDVDVDVDVPADVDDSELHVEKNNEDGDSTFWTSCPYCFYMFEYPRVYEDCCLRCQNCLRPFHGIKIAPPSIGNGKATNTNSWVFFPLGAPATEKDKAAAGSNWKPVAPMVGNASSNLTNKENVSQENVNLGRRRKARAEKRSKPNSSINNNDNYVEISESSESDGGAEMGKGLSAENVVKPQGGNGKDVNVTSDGVYPDVSESRQEASAQWGSMKRKKIEPGKKINIETYTTWKDSSLEGGIMNPQGGKGKIDIETYTTWKDSSLDGGVMNPQGGKGKIDIEKYTTWKDSSLEGGVVNPQGGKGKIDIEKYTTWKDSSLDAGVMNPQRGKGKIDIEKYTTWKDSSLDAGVMNPQGGKGKIDIEKYTTWKDSSLEGGVMNPQGGKGKIDIEKYTTWKDSSLDAGVMNPQGGKGKIDIEKYTTWKDSSLEGGVMNPQGGKGKIDIEKYTAWKDSSLEGGVMNPQGEKGKTAMEEFITIPGVSSNVGTGLKVAATGANKQAAKGTRTVAEEWARLDLNVKFSNDADEPAGGRGQKGNGAGTGEADGIEGSGFFEGLDEFLSSLPILNVVGGDKVKPVQ